MIAPEALNTIMAAVLERLCACLEADSTNGKPEKCFIYHNRPPDDCGQYLAIWMVDAYAANADATVQAPSQRDCTASRGLRLKAKLVRNCWPTLKDNPSNPFPGVEAVQIASEALLIDANVMSCCIDSLVGKMDEQAILLGITGGRIESIMPDENRGGLAGWTMQFVLAIPGCC